MVGTIPPWDPGAAPRGTSLDVVRSTFQALAFDLAGLGLIGSGVYCLVTGKGGNGAPTALLTAGGVYLGVKIPVSVSTVPVLAATTTPRANV